MDTQQVEYTRQSIESLPKIHISSQIWEGLQISFTHHLDVVSMVTISLRLTHNTRNNIQILRPHCGKPYKKLGNSATP